MLGLLVAASEAIRLDLSWLTVVVGTAIPLLTAAVTKAFADSRLKAGVTLALSILAGAGSYLIDHNGSAEWSDLFANIGSTYSAAILTYIGLWRPTGAAPAIAAATMDTGLGHNDLDRPSNTGDITRYLD